MSNGNRPIRCICTLGPSQLLFVAAALRQESISGSDRFDDILLVYGNNLSTESFELVSQLAHVVWPWREIVRADDVLDYSRLRRRRYRARSVPAIRSLLPGTDVRELWTCRLTGQPEQAAMKAFPHADVVFYDDGIASYVDTGSPRQLARHPRRALRELSLRVLKRLSSVSLVSHLFARSTWPIKDLSHAYTMFAEVLPFPQHFAGVPRTSVDAGIFRKIIEEIQHCLPDPFQFNVYASEHHRRVLLLAQQFHRTGRITWADELRVYTKVCIELSQAGYTVLWKEHPKAVQPFLKSVLAQVPNVRPANSHFNDKWPIEILADRLQLSACVSATSTSLLTLPTLCNVPTFSFSDRIPPAQLGVHADAARLIRQVVPSMKRLVA